MRFSRRVKKGIALSLLTILTTQLLLPNVALALTSGPSQPEVQSFEPVGTTDMVDMFSGDFVYNIPLMDVEGYPVNISYHGGVTMEQEASWVGLGWNINPGEINRNVRGIPDDFNGDTLSKDFHMQDDKTLRVGVGGGIEALGLGDPVLSASASVGAYLNFNNYRGVSCDLEHHVGVSLFGVASVGVNIGVGSQTGAEVDLDAHLSLSSAQMMSKDMSCGIGLGVTQGYSTRSGIKDLNFNISASVGMAGASTTGNLVTNTIPIGIRNYVPVITNSSTMSAIYGRLKLGGEVLWCYPYFTINGMFSKVHYKNDGSKDSYGYLYLEKSQNLATQNQCILDFTRDKDGMFNKSMQYLPPASLTYDIYSVTGQGTGGAFRPYRNDFGSVYDPVTKSHQFSYSGGVEAGLGWIFEIGGDYTNSVTDIKSGPWDVYQRQFKGNEINRIYESSYLKQGGELTDVDSQYFADIHGFAAFGPGTAGLGDRKANSMTKRDARGNLVYYFTGEEASVTGIGTDPQIVSYTSTNGFENGPDVSKTTINRVGTNKLQHKKDEISEIVQLQKDGKKYIYNVPALNHVQKEVTFSVNPGDADLHSGIATFGPTDNSIGNSKGVDKYYSSTVTPSYVHSYLLGAVLSADYVDATGDGITDDDLGSYTRMHYTLKESDYRWKAPFGVNKAQYNRGFLSDPNDDKASYVCGSREQWILHSIETKNFVAEFYTSERNDACGSTEPIVTNGSYNIAPYNTGSTAAHSYKLDSIKLYNKHERFINKSTAIPIKSVFFVYSDTLCQGIPNKISGGSTAGKLTLDKIYFKYGNSQRSMISPYQFGYGFNPDYDVAAKNRWGGYKPTNDTFSNYEFPFVNQSDPLNNTYASAWSLTDIYLPSGGVIHAQYESDDYAYVQDKRANEMFMIKGVGNGPSFNPSTQLYSNEKSPYLYAYFLRRTADENPSLSLRDNYFKGQDLIYFNFNLNIGNSFEQIKGYASVADIDVCPGASAYGYIKFNPVTVKGGEATLHPVTYIGVNTGRYNLPQIIFPGSSTDPGGIGDIGEGLSEAFAELVNIYKNPLVRLVKKKNNCKHIVLNKSFVRLQSPGLKKKGGDQRVKGLAFYDSWQSLAGGNEQDASYGKSYWYYMEDETYGFISSGVASYEPEIGGDENPLKQPVKFEVQSGSNFPPTDPIDLYQETPIGESLYPAPSVGYRKIMVLSLNRTLGKSSQGIDIYKFYTAKDFPVRMVPTAIQTEFKHHFSLFSQENTMTATQGYSLILNDMHGKPKSVEHLVHTPGGTDKMISYQVFNYKTLNGQLDNHVRCLVPDLASGTMKEETRQLGVEADVTLDTREKDEDTKNNTYNANVNMAGVLFIVFPIILAYPWHAEYHNQFRSATVTKVIQQYGILDNVQAYNEGAVTVQKNELFDPKTGQVVVTSINNEFQDKESTVNIPAYWAYKGMGPAYENIKYEGTINQVHINTDHMGEFTFPDYLKIGDQLFITFKDGTGAPHETNVWFMSTQKAGGGCRGYLLPRFPLNTDGWVTGTSITDVHFKVVNSGAKNMLNEIVETYSLLTNPVNSGYILKNSMDSVISISAKTFCDSNTRITNRYIANADTINPYAIGERGVYRLLADYAFVSDRNYIGTTVRNAGLFSASRLFSVPIRQDNCGRLEYNYISPDTDPNWRVARTITKWSPNGQEVENMDAIGNFSTAVYGYNNQLPVAVASNAQQGTVCVDGFEDYSLLRTINPVMRFDYSPFRAFFSTTSMSPSSATYNLFNLSNGTSAPSIVSSNSHTGMYSLSLPAGPSGTPNIYPVDLPILMPYTSTTQYNAYYSSSFTFSSINEYLPFKLENGKKYILSFWIGQGSPTANLTTYNPDAACGMKIDGILYPLIKKSNIIDGWQQVETTFSMPSATSSAQLILPANYYVDDVRIFPSDANMKAFVYHPVNEKLMATLDENNFATLYEYDQEGNLVRTKKETEKGIMTVSESRKNNPLK